MTAKKVKGAFLDLIDDFRGCCNGDVERLDIDLLKDLIENVNDDVLFKNVKEKIIPLEEVLREKNISFFLNNDVFFIGTVDSKILKETIKDKVEFYSNKISLELNEDERDALFEHFINILDIVLDTENKKMK